MREILLENLIVEARKTEMHMIGIDVKEHNLTNEEKRYLVDKGLHFSGGRNNRSLLLYTQELRSRDARLRVKRFKEIKREALERLEELTVLSDDSFVNANFDRPLSNRDIGANFSDMMEEADNLVDEGIMKKNDAERLREWFLDICGDYLIDRYSKIDWKAREEAKKRFQRSLARTLGVKETRWDTKENELE